MAIITIRNLDEQSNRRLRERAVMHGRAVEEEARALLRAALAQDAAAPDNLATAIRAHFRPLGGVELKLPSRD